MANNGLRRGENEVVLALAQGHTIQAASTTTGVSGRTIRRWLEDDDFRQRVAELRTEILAATVGQLVAASTSAVQTLVEALGDERGQTRVAAARVLLQAVLALRESLDLEERIAALERETAEQAERSRS